MLRPSPNHGTQRLPSDDDDDDDDSNDLMLDRPHLFLVIRLYHFNPDVDCVSFLDVHSKSALFVSRTFPFIVIRVPSELRVPGFIQWPSVQRTNIVYCILIVVL